MARLNLPIKHALIPQGEQATKSLAIGHVLLAAAAPLGIFGVFPFFTMFLALGAFGYAQYKGHPLLATATKYSFRRLTLNVIIYILAIAFTAQGQILHINVLLLFILTLILTPLGIYDATCIWHKRPLLRFSLRKSKGLRTSV